MLAGYNSVSASSLLRRNLFYKYLKSWQKSKVDFLSTAILENRTILRSEVDLGALQSNTHDKESLEADLKKYGSLKKLIEGLNQELRKQANG
jgi:hypothetical protein